MSKHTKPWLPPEQYYAAGDSYAARTFWLTQLGFRSYRDYLESDLWKEVRQKGLKRARWVCKICTGIASQIHHTRYHKNDLTGKCLKNLVALCGKCHGDIEYSHKGNKKTLAEANYVLGRLSKKEWHGSTAVAQSLKVHQQLDDEFDAIFGAMRSL